MPGDGRSGSPTVRIIGAIVALIAIVGYLVFEWSWRSDDALPAVIGTLVAVSIIGWSFYRVESVTANG